MSNERMITLLLCLISVFSGVVASNNRTATADPLLVVVIMVKNEEPVIVESLEGYVKGGVDAFLVYDTGSTDRTIERITDYFNKIGITRFVIEQEPFVDFASSRNRGIALAEHHFPNAGFFIMPDAEWYIHGVEELLQFCRQALMNEHYNLFSITTYYKDDSSHYGVPRLFRTNAYIRFKYRVHEIPISDRPTFKVPESVWIDHNPSAYGDEKTHRRIARDIEWLFLEHKEDPADTRPLYYLGQEYTVLGEYHKAIKYLKMRNQLADQVGEKLPEEHFVALLRMGQMYEQLFFKGEASWQDAEDMLIRAALYRPSRLEPLIHLASHYMYCNDLVRAYVYLIQACNAPYPNNDVLSINKELYDFDRWNILAGVAAQLGKLSEAYDAACIALNVHPDAPIARAVSAHCRQEFEKQQQYMS